MSAPLSASRSHSRQGPAQQQPSIRRRLSFTARRILRSRKLLSLFAVSLAFWVVRSYFSRTSEADKPTANARQFVRKGEDWLDSVNPLYRVLVPLEAPPSPFPVLQRTRMLPPRCMENWFLRGDMTCSPADMGEEDKLDVTWLWVNGSDTRWSDEMIYWRRHHDIYSPEFHFRELNELVYSMRSALASLPGLVRNFHLVLYDFPFDASRDKTLLPESTRLELGLDSPHSTGGDLRVAQTPAWLNFSSLTTLPHQDGAAAPPRLRYAVHSELFHLPSGDRHGNAEYAKAHAAREKAWREKALPTYSSKSIETRFGWLPDLADVFVAMNDDFFLLKRHAISDFHSTMYGSVIRFDYGFYQQVRPILHRKTFDDAGETGGLYHANYWLSRRFPTRLRPYVAHGPKILSRSLHHEASLMFSEVLTNSSSRRFRELPDPDGDIQIQWLLTALRVERWREALLWTFVVANVGAKEGRWDMFARDHLASLLGVRQGEPGATANVHRGERYTLEMSRISNTFSSAGWPPPQVAKYLFSSLDGHMPPIIHRDRDQTVNDFCVINMDDCFGSFWKDHTPTASDEVFKRITFEQPQCGDCLILALVSASGPLGLSAFFPPAKQSFRNPVSTQDPPVPHLPLTSTWQEADFSLPSVLAESAPAGNVNLCRYCMELLSRYLYVSGDVPAEFHMLKDASQTRTSLATIDQARLAAALGLNDNIENDFTEIKQKLVRWFESKWPVPAPWERHA